MVQLAPCWLSAQVEMPAWGWLQDLALPPLLYIPFGKKAMAVQGRLCISLVQPDFGVSLPVSRSLVLAKNGGHVKYYRSCIFSIVSALLLLGSLGAVRVGAWEQQARFEV